MKEVKGRNEGDRIMASYDNAKLMASGLAFGTVVAVVLILLGVL